MLKLGFLIVLFFLSFSCAFSQPCDGPGCGANPDAPIPGIEILLAAGSLFGFKKVLDIKKKNKTS